jgi:general stress protein 26
MTEINYDLLENEFFEQLKKKQVMVLATSYENKVTARNMSCILINKKIYFQTNTSMTKFIQIFNNPNVALCVDNIQIEGVASIKNHPLAEKEFIDIYKEIHTGSYEAYSHMEGAVVIEVEPVYVTIWKYENGEPLRDFLDLRNKKATREIYDHSK